MNAFAGTGTLIRFILRRDRIRLPVWIIAIVLTVIGTAASYNSGTLYANDAEVAARNGMITANPAAIVVTGPAYGYDSVTLDNMGPMVANEMSGTTLLLVALMSILLVVRHTRTEEETGRAELVRAAVVGRYAAPVAVLVVMAGAHVLLGLLLALGLLASGLPAAGSFAFGVGVASVGIVFAAIAILTAQFAEFGRGAVGLALSVVGVTFLLRGIGDIGDGTLSWLSPFGWAQAMRPYAGEVWWPPLLQLGLTLLVVIASFLMLRRRDVGAGLVRPRPGPALASGLLGGPVGLAFRLQRGSLVVWAIVLALMGFVVAGVVTQADALAEMEALRRMFIRGEDLVDSILGTYLLFMAWLAIAYALLAAGQLRSEETSGRAEPVLSTAVSRIRWAGSQLAVVAFGAVIVLAIGGLTAGLTHAINEGDASQLPRLVGAALVWAPATLAFVGLAVALFGVWPRGLLIPWLVFTYGALVGIFAPLLQLPEWIEWLSPIGLTPLVPAVELEVVPLVGLTLVAAGLMAVGLLGFARRDLQSPA